MKMASALGLGGNRSVFRCTYIDMDAEFRIPVSSKKFILRYGTKRRNTMSKYACKDIVALWISSYIHKYHLQSDHIHV